MITAIVGKPGSGKTLQLVRLTWDYLKKGRDVYSNVIMDFSRLMKKNKKYGKLYLWKRLDEFQYIFNGIVIADELGAYVDSRGYMDFPPDVRVKFQQYRKDGVDIYYTVQAFGRADIIIRQLTNQVIECNNIGFIFWATRYFTEDFEAKEIGKRKHQGQYMYLFNKKIANCYDHRQGINRNIIKDYKFHLMKDVIKELNENAI